VYDAIGSLKDIPHRGRVGREEGTRELFLPPLPYVAVYRVKEQSIQILRVYHAAQDRPSQRDSTGTLAGVSKTVTFALPCSAASRLKLMGEEKTMTLDDIVKRVEQLERLVAVLNTRTAGLVRLGSNRRRPNLKRQKPYIRDVPPSLRRLVASNHERAIAGLTP
jgi:hypothetical protein